MSANAQAAAPCCTTTSACHSAVAWINKCMDPSVSPQQRRVVSERVAFGKHHPAAANLRGQKEIPNRLAIGGRAAVHGNFRSVNHGIAPSVRRQGDQFDIPHHLWCKHWLVRQTDLIVVNAPRQSSWPSSC